MFQNYRELVLPSHPQGLQNFMHYIEDTWVTNSIFTPWKWSVFGHSIPTNNDVEGWHGRLNRIIARCEQSTNVNIYELINVMFSGSKFASGSTLVAEALQKHIPTDPPINGLPYFAQPCMLQGCKLQ
jgi:hypothetical protein